MRDVVTIGETMMALRAQGPVQLAAPMLTSIAGAESNVAIALSRLGHVSAWVGRVGEDSPGDLIVRTLRGEAVDVSGVVRDPHHTGIIIFERRMPGVQKVAYARAGSAGSRLVADDLPPLLDTRVLHVTGITPALSSGAADAVVAACSRAREQGVLVCLDVNHRPRLWPRERASEFFARLRSLVDVVVASPDELSLLIPDAESTRDGAHQLVADGVREVVVKDGSGEAYVVTAEETISAPAFRVESVDAIGAGDAFVAGYLSGLLDGIGIADRLVRAHTLGAFAVGVEGDWEGLPTRAELGLLDSGDGTVLR
ncbi:sugar kinase [Aeromicrobium sp. CF3.5]|uniref:sugar kinase n=1 Tax=Aeromicrobium sp. CF3.5 TaxID=3373078 RepID=UPI003EE74C66